MGRRAAAFVVAAALGAGATAGVGGVGGRRLDGGWEAAEVATLQRHVEPLLPIAIILVLLPAHSLVAGVALSREVQLEPRSASHRGRGFVLVCATLALHKPYGGRASVLVFV
eukprot:scaffold113267_cov48-Phaeocystis_antarctica.AAC.2